MIIYFADRKMEILGAASTDLPEGLHIISDKRTSDLETGTATLELTLEYDDQSFSRSDAERYTEAPNYILRYNEALKSYEYYTIFTSEEDLNEKTIDIEAEDGGMDLLNETMNAVTYDTPKTCRELMNVALNDTGFKIGQYDVDDSNKKALDFQEETALSRLNSIAAEFEVEIFFTFDVKAYAVTGKYLNVVKKRGNADPVDLRYGHEVSNIRISKSAEDIATGFRVYGSQESRDGFFVGLDSTGHKRYCWVKWADGYEEKTIKSGSDKGKIEYSAPGMSDVPMNKGWIGIAYYKNTPEKSSKPEDYTWKKIGTQTGTTAETIKWDGWGIKVGSKYAWVRYADRSNGSGFSDSPVGKRYVCIALDKDTASKSNLWTDYMFFPFADTENASTLTLAGTQYDDGDVYWDEQNGLLLSRTGNSKWSRYVSGETGTAAGYIIRNMSYTTTDQKDLLDKAVKDLKKMSQINVTYEVDLIDFPEYLACGDYVNVLDESGDLYVKARIQKVEDSIINGTKQLTLGDFKQLQSEISEQVQSLADQFKEQSEYLFRYTWIVYADDMSGTNMSVEPGSREYMGIATNRLTESPDMSNPDIYQWKKIVGEQGQQGERGIQGIQGEKGDQGIQGPPGKSSYIHIKYSKVENPTDSDLTEDPSDYIGICTTEDETDPTTASSYTWSKFQGEDGTQGIQGEKGADGKTTYVHFAYSTSSDGTAGFSVTPFSGAEYIGVCTNYTQADPTTPSSYKWSRFLGEQGPQGLRGIQGEKGDQGIPGTSSYTHIAYANSADGSQGFSVSDPNGKTYIGVLVDQKEKDSTAYSDYTWSRIKGQQGDQGIPGKDGTNGSTAYLHIAYANSADGKTDFTIDDTKSAGKQYIGQYTDHTQADSTTYTDYHWSKIKGEQGIQGAQGEQGVKGEDGKTTYFHIKYSSVANPTDAQITETPSEYIGTYVDFTQADSTHASDYTWARFKGQRGDQGIPGVGTDGKTSYLHIAYANSADGSSGFDVSDSKDKLYIGQYVDFTQADSTKYSDYHWTKIKGENGDTGPQGDPGKDGVSLQSFKTQYYLSSSQTGLSGGSWSESLPEYKDGWYYWYRTVQTFSDGTTKTTDPQLYGGQTQASKNALDATGKVTQLDNALNAQGIINRLTNNGKDEGLYYQNNHVYINATYIMTGTLASKSGNTKLDLDDGTFISRQNSQAGSNMVKVSAGKIEVGYGYSITGANGKNINQNSMVEIYGSEIDVTSQGYKTVIGGYGMDVYESGNNSPSVSIGYGGIQSNQYYSTEDSSYGAATMLGCGINKSTGSGIGWGRWLDVGVYGMGDGGTINIGPNGTYTYAQRGSGYGNCTVKVKGHAFKSFNINGTRFCAFEP